MKKILLRSHKDPFTVLSAEETLRENAIGNNGGNLIFSHAVHRILALPGTEIVTSGFRSEYPHPARVNDEFDAFVVPLANAFRPSFRRHLVKLTRFIERLSIPVVVFGVGAQGTLDYDDSRLAPIADNVKRFVRAVLERGPSIGVRGDFTYTYLRKLGFNDVDVIGCPSMFLHGGELRLEQPSEKLTADARIAINISPYVRSMGAVAIDHFRRHPNLTYIAQDIESLRLLLYGRYAGAEKMSPEAPVRVSHPLYQKNRIKLFLDPPTWMDHLATYDFSFGTRIHGNIAALMAGTPAYVLAHDSRTLELARYFDIPHMRFSPDATEVVATRLYEEADYSRFIKGHQERFSRMLEFMEKHRLPHVFGPGGDGGATFDARVRATCYPPAVEPLTAGWSGELVARLGLLTDKRLRVLYASKTGRSVIRTLRWFP